MSSAALRAGWVLAAALLAAAPAAAAGGEEPVAVLRRAFEKAAPAAERAAAVRGVAGLDHRAAAEAAWNGLASVLGGLEALAARRAEVRAGVRAVIGEGENLAEGERGPRDAEGRARLAALLAEEEDLRGRDAAEREVEALLRRTLSRFRDPKAVDFLASLPGRSSLPGPLRAAALEALGAIPSEAAGKALKAALGDRDPGVREAAIAALSRGGAGGKEGLAALAGGLADDRWTVRLAAARALAALGTPEAVDLLVPRLAREEGRVASEIAALLRGLTGQRFGPEVEGWAHWWAEHRGEFASGGRRLTPGAPGPAPPGGGPPGGASYYGITVESRRVLFVIDVSGSMNEPGGRDPDAPKVEDAKRELLRCLRSLDGGSAFTVFSFHDTVAKWRPRLARADAAAREDAARWVEALSAASWTNTGAALEEALAASAADPRNNMGKDYDLAADTIFLLTDGAPTTPGGKLRDARGEPEYLRVLDLVRARNRERRVAIHAIGIGPEYNAEFLSTLARENGGTFVAIR